MKKLLFSLLLLIPLVVAACGGGASAAGGGNAPGGGGGGGATVNMNAANFVPNNSTVTVKAGQAVTFVDPAASGGLHYLVTGTNGAYTAEAGAPAALSVHAGMRINAGDTKSMTFATAGSYKITCTIHPYMEVTVTVTP